MDDILEKGGEVFEAFMSLVNKFTLFVSCLDINQIMSSQEVINDQGEVFIETVSKWIFGPYMMSIVSQASKVQDLPLKDLKKLLQLAFVVLEHLVVNSFTKDNSEDARV